MERDYERGVDVQNKYGDWVPAIPVPLYRSRSLFRLTYTCKCKRGFKSEEEYRGHYALDHILGLPRN